MKIAYLVDGGYVKASLKRKNAYIGCQNILKLLQHIRAQFPLQPTDDSETIYFDCPPYVGKLKSPHPLTGKIDEYTAQDTLLTQLESNGITVVRGRLKHAGWNLKKELLGNVSTMAMRIYNVLSQSNAAAFQDLRKLAENIAQNGLYKEDDFVPVFQQKKVDGQIMDKMTDLVLEEENLREIVLVSNDSDFVANIQKNRERAIDPLKISLVHLDGPEIAVSHELAQHVDRLVNIDIRSLMAPRLSQAQRITSYMPNFKANNMSYTR